MAGRLTREEMARELAEVFTPEQVAVLVEVFDSLRRALDEPPADWQELADSTDQEADNGLVTDP
jgi:hypothetical protein